MKKAITFFLILISFPALACWKLKAQINIAGEQLRIDQKIVHGKVYSFTTGPYLVDIKMPEAKQIIWIVSEKKNLTLKKLFTHPIAVRLNEEIKSDVLKIKGTQQAHMNFEVSEI